MLKKNKGGTLVLVPGATHLQSPPVILQSGYGKYCALHWEAEVQRGGIAHGHPALSLPSELEHTASHRTLICSPVSVSCLWPDICLAQ